MLKFLFLNFSKNINIIVGSFLDLKSGLSLKKFFNSFGCSNFIYSKFNVINKFNFDFKYFYVLHQSLSELEKLTFILFLSINLRLESPLLNSRIRKNYMLNSNSLLLFSIGISLKYLTYPIRNLGNNIKTFLLFIQENHVFFVIYFLKICIILVF